MPQHTDVTFLIVVNPHEPRDAVYTTKLRQHLKRRQKCHKKVSSKHSSGYGQTDRSLIGTLIHAGWINKAESNKKERRFPVPDDFRIIRWRHGKAPVQRRAEEDNVANITRNLDSCDSPNEMHNSGKSSIKAYSGNDLQQARSQTSPLCSSLMMSELGSGTMPVDVPPTHLHELVEHAVCHFWPGLYPSGHVGRSNPANSIFLSHLSNNQLAFCTYLLNVSLNLDYLNGTSPKRRSREMLRMHLMYEASKIVQAAIASLPECPGAEDITDELIASVCCLSSASVVTIVSKHERCGSRFRSPLATAQHLDMWGTAGFSKPHRLALVRLVILKGGLSEIAFQPLAAIIQLADLIDATSNFTTPMLPYHEDPILTRYAIQDQYRHHTCRSLDKLPPNCSHVVYLRLVMSTVSAANAALIHWYQNGSPDKDLASLCDQRTKAHHMTMTIPAHGFTECGVSVGDRTVDTIYSIVRLSLRIYDNLVLFPLPILTGVDSRLAHMLYLEFQKVSTSCDMSGFGEFAPLLLWASVLGGIGDSKDAYRLAFKDTFDKILRLMSLQNWMDIEAVLASFVWCDFVLNEEAVKFWLRG